MKHYLYCYTSEGKVKAVEANETKCLNEDDINNMIVFGGKTFELFETEEFDKILKGKEDDE